MVSQYNLTAEQQTIQNVARQFAAEKLLSRYMQGDTHESVIDRELLKEIGELGLIGPELPEDLGGLGLSCITTGLIIEVLAHGDFNVASVLVSASLTGQIIAANARHDVALDWVPRMINGEALVAIALTEPRGGSDAASLVLSATRCDGGYRMNGEKTSITFAGQADAVVTFARTGEPGSRAGGVSAFLLPTDSQGITTTRFRDLGNRVVGRGSYFFDDVFVPEEYLLGEEGKGFGQVMHGFDYSRALLGLLCLGTAQASLDDSWAYVNEREAFGKTLSEFQGVTFPLAEFETRVAAARELCYHALRLKDEGKPHTSEAAMCKWLGPVTARDTIHQCLLTFGHYGWSEDLPHQQRLRDVMAMEIGDGTAQIMKMIIARQQAVHARERA